MSACRDLLMAFWGGEGLKPKEGLRKGFSGQKTKDEKFRKPQEDLDLKKFCKELKALDLHLFELTKPRCFRSFCFHNKIVFEDA